MGSELSPRRAGGSQGAVCLEDVLGGRTVQRPLRARRQLEPEDPLLVLPHEGGGVVQAGVGEAAGREGLARAPCALSEGVAGSGHVAGRCRFGL